MCGCWVSAAARRYTSSLQSCCLRWVEWGAVARRAGNNVPERGGGCPEGEVFSQAWGEAGFQRVLQDLLESPAGEGECIWE
jgi:hypothetical protein